MPVALGEFHKIGQRIHVRLGVAVAVEKFLPLPDHAHVAVVQIDDLHRQVILLAGGELLDAHLDRGFAGNAGHGRTRVSKDRPHRKRKAHAHGAQTTRVNPAARLVKFVKLRRPHLMLADVRSDDGISAGKLVQLFDHRLRLDDRAVAVVFQTVAGTPGFDLLPPFFERRDIRLGFGSLQQLEHVLKDIGHTANDGHVNLDALGNRRRINVNVDDLARVLGKVFGIADHAIVEARADGQQHIAILHRHVRLVGTVHAEHAERMAVGCGESAKTHQGVGARKSEMSHKLGELGRRIGQNDAAAGVNHRSLCL